MPDADKKPVLLLADERFVSIEASQIISDWILECGFYPLVLFTLDSPPGSERIRLLDLKNLEPADLEQVLELCRKSLEQLRTADAI